jgi:hypothetical protein
MEDMRNLGIHRWWTFARGRQSRKRVPRETEDRSGCSATDDDDNDDTV